LNIKILVNLSRSVNCGPAPRRPDHANLGKKLRIQVEQQGVGRAATDDVGQASGLEMMGWTLGGYLVALEVD
jgi:hypothetical protein